MAKRNIVKMGDDVLRKVCRTQLDFDAKLHQILDDMAETMYEAEGVGLAAPQIGVVRRVVIIIDGETNEMVALINPEITAMSGVQHKNEGCLSVPGVFGKTERPAVVTVKAQNEKGEWFELTRDGITAVCICHELDHLDGILFREHVIEYYEDEE